jgi:hypothetical protein
VVTSVKTNKVSLVGKPFYVSVTVTDRASLPRKATVTIASGTTSLAKRSFTFRPRRRTTVKLPITLSAPGRTPVTVTLTGTKPRRVSVDVAEFRVRPSAVLVPALAGYGGQFNHHVYAALSRSVGVTDENVVDMEQKMRALHPEFSRVFFTPQAFTDPDKMQSFIRTVQFAQSTGTTINITWQGGTLSAASGTVQKFANVLLDLVRNRGITNFRWLTLQNEPNRTRITMQAYEAQYRELDPLIQSIRGQVRYMGGDLVRGPDTGAPNQDVWFQYLAAHMSDLLDAYSIHVFWDYWDTQKLDDRRTEARLCHRVWRQGTAHVQRRAAGRPRRLGGRHPGQPDERQRVPAGLVRRPLCRPRLSRDEQVGLVLREVRQRDAVVLHHRRAAERLAALSALQLHAVADDDREARVAGRCRRLGPEHVTDPRRIPGQEQTADGRRPRHGRRATQHRLPDGQLVHDRRIPAV